MIISLEKEFRFEASHQLPNHDGKCARLHGHSWVLTVEVTSVVGEKAGDPKEGMVMDYSDIKAAVEPIIDVLDHRHLGSGYVDGDAEDERLYLPPDPEIGPTFPRVPTSENILIWISEQLPARLPWTTLTLMETCTARATLQRLQDSVWVPGDSYPITIREGR